MKKTKVISAFPGAGKTFYTNNSDNIFGVFDSDSSSYSWIEEDGTRIRNPLFPMNYIEHIKGLIGVADIIFVSSHDVVRQGLRQAGIDYTLVYPSRDIKEEYVQRYIDRGNNEHFVETLQEKWDIFIDEIEQETFPSLIQLKAGQYLADVINNIE